MKKRILALAMLTMMVLSLTAQAATFALGGSPRLTISGTTATCSVSCQGESDDEIKVILTLWCGESIVDSWSKTGTGKVVISETCKVVAGNRYDLVMMPVVNGEALDTVTVTAYS